MALRVLRRWRTTAVAPDRAPAETGPVTKPTVAPVADPAPARDPFDLLATYGRALRGLSPAPTEGTVMVCGLGPARIEVAVAAADVDDAYWYLVSRVGNDFGVGVCDDQVCRELSRWS